MNTHILRFFGVILAVAAFTLPPLARAQLYGIGNVDVTDRPVYDYVELSFVIVQWKNIETADNVFDWTGFNNSISVVPASQPAVVSVYTGRHAPAWLFKAPGAIVPLVTTNGSPAEPNATEYPYYLDPDYINRLERFILKLRQHISAMSATLQNKIQIVQGGYASTGDYNPYHGTPDNSAYIIDGATWQSWWRARTQYWFNQFDPYLPEKPLLFNPSNDTPTGPDNLDWLKVNCPGSYFKAGNLGHIFQMNLEIDSTFAWVKNELNPDSNGRFNRARSEFDESEQRFPNGWWSKAPKWNMYCLLLNALHVGLDDEFLTLFDINKTASGDMYRFFNTYAGQKSASSSPGGFVALRDGIDASDTTRFPEATYGSATQFNQSRYSAIATALASRGAKQDHLAASGWTGVKQRQETTALNDVGWRIHTGNYYRYIEQILTSTTSLGWWRVGPIDATPVTTGSLQVAPGRFARSTNHAAAKDELFFKFSSGFWTGHGAAGSRTANFRIVYFDKGTSKWNLRYDSATSADTLALSVTNANSLKWKEAKVTVTNGYFGQRGANGSDFRLKLVTFGGSDPIFHMVEVKRP